MTALLHWGLTEQVPQVIDLAIRRGIHFRKRPDIYQRVRVLYVSPPQWFGIVQVWVGDGEAVPMFSRERMLYDAFLVPARYGGLGAAMEFLQTARDERNFQIELLVSLCIQGRSRRTLNRLARAIEEVLGNWQIGGQLRSAAEGLQKTT
ncbi:MAG: type IV toxin-antitoxin system AbiEi family antitoxin domain-containing protein [Candidatus Dormibacteraceae bacterium]